MFQAAIAVVNGIEHEEVIFDWRLALAVPEADGGLADFLGVGQQAFAVKRWRGTRHHEAVGHAAGGELPAPEGSHFDRAVHQFVVVACRIHAKAPFVDGLRRQPRGDRPVGGGRSAGDFECMGCILLAMHTQAHAGAIEEAARGIQPSRAHRAVVGTHFVGNYQGAVGAAGGAPAVLVQLQEGHTPALLCTQALQIFGKFAHQITARYPDRKRQLLLFLRVRHGQCDGEQPGMWVGGFDAVVNRGLGGLAGLAGGFAGGTEGGHGCGVVQGGCLGGCRTRKTSAANGPQRSFHLPYFCPITVP